MRPPDPARDQASHQQSLHALGQVTGGIAHDFNNLLTVIIGNLETADLHSGSDAAATARRQKAIASALRGAHRAATLSQRLLSFTRRQTLAPKPVEVERLVMEEVDFLRRIL